MRFLAVFAAFELAACTDSTTYLKNEKTGQVVTCGGQHPVTLVESAVQKREQECIEDYKAQGYIRVPSAK
jgi:hypothetical protein